MPRLVSLALAAAVLAALLPLTARPALAQEPPTPLDAEACGDLSAGECRVSALRLQFGLGAPSDLHRALLQFEAACTAGDTFACTEAGVAYAMGLGGGVDEERARAFFRFGCRAALPKTCRAHGLTYLDPKSPVQNLFKASAILTQACWAGSGGACMTVALLNASGDLGKDSMTGRIDSLRYYREGCVLGIARACTEGAALIKADPRLSLFAHTEAFMTSFACSALSVEEACAE